MAKSVKLGQRVRDKITGFEGVVIARTEWLHNTPEVVVQPSALSGDGGIAVPEKIDEERVEVVSGSGQAVGFRRES